MSRTVLRGRMSISRTFQDHRWGKGTRTPEYHLAPELDDDDRQSSGEQPQEIRSVCVTVIREEFERSQWGKRPELTRPTLGWTECVHPFEGSPNGNCDNSLLTDL